VVERDHDVRHVEQRLGKPDRVGLRNRDPLPAGGHLVRQVADPGVHREGKRDSPVAVETR
jgi:hypothetical protein